MSWNKVSLTTAPMPKPPKGRSSIECNHKWVYQGSDYEKRERNRFQDSYSRMDTYYCEKCLEIKEIKAKEEDCEKKPYWFKE